MQDIKDEFAERNNQHSNGGSRVPATISFLTDILPVFESEKENRCSECQTVQKKIKRTQSSNSMESEFSALQNALESRNRSPQVTYTKTKQNPTDFSVVTRVELDRALHCQNGTHNDPSSAQNTIDTCNPCCSLYRDPAILWYGHQSDTEENEGIYSQIQLGSYKSRHPWSEEQRAPHPPGG